MNPQNDNQKNVYQVPQQTGAVAGGENEPSAVLSDQYVETQIQSMEDAAREETNRQFAAIASQDILADFNRITEDLEMSLLGEAATRSVELMSPHPIAEQLLQIGDIAEAKRHEFHAALLEEQKKRRAFSSMVSTLFTNTRAKTPAPTLESIIDHESKTGGIFPQDPDVKEIKFFFLRDGETHKWYHVQSSVLPEKDFTNTYSVQPYGITKSSTFFDPTRGQKVNVSVPVQDAEAQNLLIAAKNYYEEVTGKVYVKSAAPRLRFGTKKNDSDTKSGYDLAA